MIDLAPYAAPAVALAFAGVGGALLFRSLRKPKWTDPDDAPELDADFFYRAEVRHGDEVIRPARCTLTKPDAVTEASELFAKADAEAGPVGIVIDPKTRLPAIRPDTEYAMKRHAAMANHVATINAPPPRYTVRAKPWRDGLWYLQDRDIGLPGAHLSEHRTGYTRRSSALRAARRLNAKEAAK